MLSQYDDSPNIKAMVTGIVAPLQQLEDEIQKFNNTSGISNATGVMLDIIGSWVDVERDGRLDESLKTVILGKVSTEGADGTTEKFLDAMRTLSGQDQALLFEYYPSAFYPVLGSGWTTGMVDELRRLAPAGTEMRLGLSADLKYLEYAEIGEQDDLLHDQDGNSYQVVIDGIEYDLATSVVADSSAFGTDTIMSELGFEVEGNNYPMVDLVLTGAKVINRFLVDEQGNNIVDDQGNLITVVNLIN